MTNQNPDDVERVDIRGLVDEVCGAWNVETPIGFATDLQNKISAAIAAMPRGGGRYRLLTKDDTIQAGDQVLADDCLHWVELAGWEIGMQYAPWVLMPIRRPILPESSDE